MMQKVKVSLQFSRRSSALWLPFTVVLAVAFGTAVVYSAPLALAILVVSGICLAAGIDSRWLLYGIVLLGPLPLGAMSDKQKNLLTQFGGVDAEGMRLFAVVLLVSLVLILAAGRVAPSERRRPIRIVYGFVLAMLAWCGLELLRSPDLNLGVRLWFKLAYLGLVALLAAEMTWSSEERRQLGNIALSAACILLVVGWAAGLKAGFGSGLLDTSSVLHPTPFGLALVFYTVLSYALAPSSHRFPLYVLLIVTALITLERTVWLSVFLIGSVFWVLRSRSSLRWLVPPVLGLLAVTAVLTYRPFYDRFFYAALPKGESLTLRTLPLNTNGRDAAWAAILQRVDQKTFLYGRGMGAADNLFRIQNVLPGSLTGVVHNEYLRLLYDAGFLAPMLFLAALAFLLLAVLRWRDDTLIRAALAGMVAAYPFAALFDNAIDYYAYVGTGVAVLAGIFVSMNIHREDEGAGMLLRKGDTRAEGLPVALPQ
jgi:hypothetical protein